MPGVELFGIRFDPFTMQQTCDRVWEWIACPASETRYVVTPNVDHTVLFQASSELREAYAAAGMVVADGRPVVMASRMLGQPLPQCVPGSDLVPTLFGESATRGGLKVFLLGAAPGVAERAAERIHERWPAVEVVGCYSPPLGFEKDADENAEILKRVNESGAQLLVLGLGAPKQELWAARFRDQIKVPATLCVGATIDFLAGEKKRAPVWLQRLSLEWLHRMLSEPRRLVPRYARDAWVFPQLMFRQWLGQRTLKA